MKNILSRPGRDELERFARSNVLLAFDYDGTLAPIVVDRDRALMRETTCRLLQDVAKLYPVIVISGRAQVDAMRRLRASGVQQVIGNHGIEPWHAHDSFIDRAERWRRVLDDRLGPIDGVDVEDKIFSIAVHYRRSRNKAKARSTILEAVAALEDARILGGKQVINLLPTGAPNKGTALERSRARLHSDTAVYVGDDDSDEDVFLLDQPDRLLTIRVGAARTSAARHYVPSQKAVDELLRLLIDLRSHPWARPALNSGLRVDKSRQVTHCNGS